MLHGSRYARCLLGMVLAGLLGGCATPGAPPDKGPLMSGAPPLLGVGFYP